MARGLNECRFIGNVGQDPEVRFTPGGTPVANLSLAVSEKWRDKQSGQVQEKTEWVRLVAFNKTAEIIQQYVTKGSKLHVSGKLQTRKWQDQNGQDRYSTEIVVSDMIMLDSKSQNGQQNQAPQGGYSNQPQGGYSNGQQGGYPPQNQRPPQNRPPQNQAPQGQQHAPQSNYGAPDPGNFDDFDSEIPF
ncbi:single-stranded DNA-binding protein [Halomonas sp. BMC6]|uniref:single-stranded DNA-binding protein n=1 Tax=Halomonas sp. BMC6 TaxID=3073244 RepID=UPI0030CDFBD8